MPGSLTAPPERDKGVETGLFNERWREVSVPSFRRERANHSQSDDRNAAGAGHCATRVRNAHRRFEERMDDEVGYQMREET